MMYYQIKKKIIGAFMKVDKLIINAKQLLTLQGSAKPRTKKEIGRYPHHQERCYSYKK